MRHRSFVRTAAAAWLALILLAAVVSAQKVTGPPSRQSPAGPSNFGSPMVIETTLAAVDRALWRGDAWFSVDEYHDLGKYSCEGVSLRRGYNVLTDTWEPGLELTVIPRRDKKVEISFRVTVMNPKGNEDRGVTILVELLDGSSRVVKKGLMTTFVNEGEAAETDRTLVVSPAFLNSIPAPTLRLTVTSRTDVISPKKALISFVSVLGGLLLVRVMSSF